MTYRPPIYHVIYPPRSAAQDIILNVTINLTPAAVQAPFSQSDWPGPQRPSQVLASDAPANRFPFINPNPAKPFFDPDWRLAVKGAPPQQSDVYGPPSPLLHPNPPRPFSQYDWPSLPRVSISLKSDVYGLLNPLLTPNPSQPFRLSQWDSPTPGKPKAVGEALGASNPLFTPNPARPFSQSDWYQLRPVRAAKVDDVVNFLPLRVVVVTHPFSQFDWPIASRVRTAKVDDVEISLPIYSPLYPSIVTSDSTVSPRWMVPSDFFVNLLPLHSITVVAAPFSQSDWPAAATRKPTAQDFVANLLPLHNASIIIPPFVASDWPSVALPKRPVFAESFTQSLPIYHPNPTHPFAQFDWTSPTPRPAQSDRSFAEAISYIPVPVSLQPPLRTLVGTGI